MFDQAPASIQQPASEREIRAALRGMTAQERRRLNFIRAERLSASEAQHIAPDFDPGLEYETWP